MLLHEMRGRRVGDYEQSTSKASGRLESADTKLSSRQGLHHTESGTAVGRVRKAAIAHLSAYPTVRRNGCAA